MGGEVWCGIREWVDKKRGLQLGELACMCVCVCVVCVCVRVCVCVCVVCVYKHALPCMQWQ